MGNGQPFEENISTYDRSLHLMYYDLTLPGQGGFDINIIRTYSAVDLTFNGTDAPSHLGDYFRMGKGWDIHFGYISLPHWIDYSNVKYWSGLDYGDGKFESCSFVGAINSNLKDWMDNPTLNKQDGTSEIFFNSPEADYAFGTKSGWRAGCSGKSIIAYSPDGYKYIFDQIKKTAHSAKKGAWGLYPSKIEDKNGNFLNFTYATQFSEPNLAYVSTITASDDRVVNFSYADINGKTRISSISANTFNLSYSYDSDGELISVSDNAGELVAYDYHEPIGTSNYKYLKSLKTRAGGIISYEWSSTRPPTNTIDNAGINKRVTGGDLPASETLYSNQLGKVRVIEPDRCTQYDHYTYLYEDDVNKTFEFGSSVIYLWLEGSPKSEKIYANIDCSGEPLQTTEYEWGGIQVSLQAYYRPFQYYPAYSVGDVDYYKPFPLSKITTLDGIIYTTEYSNFTNFGTPTKIVETSKDQFTGEIKTSRSTEYQFAYPGVQNGLEYLMSRVVKDGAGSIVDSSIYQYDSKSQLTRQTINGISTSYTYDNSGNISSITDANFNITFYEDYIRGQYRTERDSIGTKSYSYNYFGQKKIFKDELGNFTTYKYDTSNRLISVDRSLGSDFYLTYGDAYYQTVLGDLETRYDYDGLGRTTLITEKDLNTNTKRYTNFEYDYLGRRIFASLVSDTQFESVGTGTEYDAIDRVSREITPLGDRLVEYLNESKIKYTNSRGFSSIYEYESFGEPNYENIVRMEDPSSSGTIVTSILRDAVGRILSVSQGGESLASQKDINYSYHNNYRDLVTSVSYPQFTYQFDYDAVGNQISSRVGSGSVTSYSYDSRNRRTLINYPSGTPDVVFNYDKSDNLVSALNGVGDWYYKYNENLLLSERKLSVDGKDFIFKYSYDNQDNLAKIQYVNVGLEVDYLPNAFGQATIVGNFANSISYHPTSSVKKFTYANGITYQTELASNRLLLNKLEGKYASQILVSKQYDFDPHGNAINIIDSVNPKYSVSNINYDGVDRIISAQSEAFGGVISLNYDSRGNILQQSLPDRDLNYIYDSNDYLTKIDTIRKSSGGWLLIGTGGVLAPIPFGVQNSTQNFAYDYRGNVINNSRHSFSFDEANQLISASDDNISQYRYDALGRRVQVVHPDGTKDYEVYDDLDRLLLTETKGITKSKIYLGNHLIANYSEDTTNYIHFDLIGSTVGVSDENRQIQYENYLPFGKRIDNLSSSLNDQWYTGKKFDEKLQLSYHGARYYDPSIGRFYSNDPVDFLGHIQRGNSPAHGFNRYAYANNNPYKYNDPDGEFAHIAIGAFVGAVVSGVVYAATTDSFSGGDFLINVASGAAVGALTAAVPGAIAAGSLNFGGKVANAAVSGGNAVAAGAVGSVATQAATTGNVDAGQALVAGAANAVGLVAGTLAAKPAAAFATTKTAGNPGLPVTSLSGKTFYVGKVEATSVTSEASKQGTQDVIGGSVSTKTNCELNSGC